MESEGLGSIGVRNRQAFEPQEVVPSIAASTFDDVYLPPLASGAFPNRGSLTFSEAVIVQWVSSLFHRRIFVE
jgi:hypothetical protein